MLWYVILHGLLLDYVTFYLILVYSILILVRLRRGVWGSLNGFFWYFSSVLQGFEKYFIQMGSLNLG